MNNQFNYQTILTIKNLQIIYHQIKLNSRHKEKFLIYELFLTSNLFTIFLIVDPKFRIIMSENINDKIVNHFISQYLLFPTLEPKMIPMSVATRRGKGTDLGIRYIKKYIHSLKEKYDTFFF